MIVLDSLLYTGNTGSKTNCVNGGATTQEKPLEVCIFFICSKQLKKQSDSKTFIGKFIPSGQVSRR